MRIEQSVESLNGLNDKQCANKIAEHFAKVSQEYSPIAFETLPSFLPSLPPPQVDEMSVCKQLLKIKKTKSTLPIDLPEKIRKECAVFLATPLTLIFNNCLISSTYPTIWKQEWVTPVPKIPCPQGLSDLRKISCTSDFSKLYESYLKNWIMEDIAQNIDIGQFGGQAGIGTEHMLVCFVDRILQLLDEATNKRAVIAMSLDWANAFDRQDPTIAVKKFLDLGVRPSLVPLLASYLSDRTMKVKFNNEMSEIYRLIGGGPQGTLIGGIEYIVQSNDNADIVPEEDRFKYIDDLSLVQLVCLSGALIDYNFKDHVASDIHVDNKYLSAADAGLQSSLDHIYHWTDENLMKLNVAKCNYMIISRSKEKFNTRLTINNEKLEQISVSKLLGIWISEDLDWGKNCQEICRKAYSRLSMITKLKYAGVSRDDLLDIYVLFIRSIIEYCSVVFHSSLTKEQSNKLERIQKTCLKVILANDYVDYETALRVCGLETLNKRRESKCLSFALKCINHEKNRRLFPLNPIKTDYEVRNRELFKVNFARTTAYKNSAVPYCQRLLNDHFKK